MHSRTTYCYLHSARPPLTQGDWGEGKKCFELCLQIYPRDKPARRLLMHMDTADNHPDFGLASEGQPFLAPEGWPGFHFLLSK